jgi:triosephosphate isomerase
MRIPFVAGNWKMNKTVEEARSLVFEMSLSLREIEGVEKVLCPPFPALLAVAALLEGIDIGLGAQNMHWEGKGAFTGEVSPGMVAEFCKYVILGHSERRIFLNETNEAVNRKVRAAQVYDLIPIVCVGETLSENQAGQTAKVVRYQLCESLKDLDKGLASRIVIAYEPIWAIGTGLASTGENANSVVIEIIRPALADLFGEENSQAIRVLYGGSVTSTNAAEFFKQADIDGALVGGASLKTEEFVAIARAASRL